VSPLDFTADDFLSSDGPERARKCRQLAAEADGLAANAINPDSREAYLDLKRQWNELADEIEKFGGGWMGET